MRSSGMFAARRRERSAEMSATAGGNGYAEIDPMGRYGRFDQVLGKGATKTVYRAFDQLNGTEVAWNQANLRSVLQSPAALQRMYSEVHLLSSLRHESIIGFHASWVNAEKRTLNFITEMFTSGTLREYRTMYPRVDIRAIKRWSRQILDGLAYLHGHDPPVIHRDIKCDNIFINGHLGQVKIGDLGLAALLRGSQSAHSVIGTPEFMAPELYEEDYNELADIYSFGMCVLEMLTSEYPYSECCNPAQIYKKVTSGRLPDAFNRIEDGEARRFIGRCLEKVGKRSSAKELLLDPFLELDDRIAHAVQRTDMTITGKMNAQGDTIFLRVQITDTNGQARNIYFPFDVACDTPVEVADEMVKELEIADREPSEIAEMISREISMLAPDWRAAGGASDLHYVYDHVHDAEDGGGHPFCSVSPPDSSQGSVLGQQQQHQRRHPQREGSFQGCLFSDDDEMSSTHSGKYSSVNSASVNAKETNSSTVSSRNQGQLHPSEDPERDSPLRKETERPLASRQLMRNRSMIDMRSHLLHRNLVEHLQKRLFNTVSAVEQIGLHNPCNGSQYKASSSSFNGDYSSKVKQSRSQGRIKRQSCK